jgi:hypothetical protein
MVKPSIAYSSLVRFIFVNKMEIFASSSYSSAPEFVNYYKYYYLYGNIVICVNSTKISSL